MEGMELTCFTIISSVGTARSLYIEAVQMAKAGKLDEAKALMNEGDTIFTQGHHTHMEIITQEANGQSAPFSLLLMHAEDQLMSAECLKIMAEEFIALYERMGVSSC